MPGYNIIDEPTLVKDIHQEYLRLINYYQNVKRPAAYIKYYNLVTELSPKDEGNITFDRYTKTKTTWDIYELVPAFNISAIQNAPGSIQDLKGQMIDGSTTITVYTIQNPRIDDLITFYDPIKSDEVFRVSNFRLQINSSYSTPAVKWFELDLETAPIKYQSLNDLKKRNHFIYDISTETNFKYLDYKNLLDRLELIKTELVAFKNFYSSEFDLYHYDLKVPRYTNELIYILKTRYNNKYHRIFESYLSPFGFWDKFGITKKTMIEFIPPTDNIYDVYNLKTSQWEHHTYNPLSNLGLDRLIFHSLKLKTLLG